MLSEVLEDRESDVVADPEDTREADEETEIETLDEGEELLIPEEVIDGDALDEGLVTADIEAKSEKVDDTVTETDTVSEIVGENVSEFEEEGDVVGVIVSELE